MTRLQNRRISGQIQAEMRLSADLSTWLMFYKTEIERLIAGESIEKDVAPELTYDEIYKSIENLWSVLLRQVI